VANETDNDKELKKQALDNARQDRFPKITLNFIDGTYPYTAILNLFKIEKNFNFKKDEMKNYKVPVVCLFCKKTYHSKKGRFHNLNAHIDDHAANGNVECREWLKRYREFKGVKSQLKHTQSTNNEMLLVYHFMASNSALTQLKEKSFLKICEKAGIEVPNVKTFKRRILPNAMKMLKKKIEAKLESSARICLLTDIWTNKQMLDFIAVSANLIFENFDKETVVIGMMKMPGPHNAENIKFCVEKIVNKYKFEKSKVDGMKTFANNFLINLVYL
jgi:hypothetical protein